MREGHIAVDTVVSVNATDSLMNRFDLIKFYLLRYKLQMALASAEKSYSTNLAKSQSVFDAMIDRISGRTDLLAGYNTQTRKLLFEQNLDYDMEMIQVIDSESVAITSQFSYALLMVSSSSAKCPHSS